MQFGSCGGRSFGRASNLAESGHFSRQRDETRRDETSSTSLSTCANCSFTSHQSEMNQRSVPAGALSQSRPASSAASTSAAPVPQVLVGSFVVCAFDADYSLWRVTSITAAQASLYEFNPDTPTVRGKIETRPWSKVFLPQQPNPLRAGAPRCYSLWTDSKRLSSAPLFTSVYYPVQVTGVTAAAPPAGALLGKPKPRSVSVLFSGETQSAQLPLQTKFDQHTLPVVMQVAPVTRAHLNQALGSPNSLQRSVPRPVQQSQQQPVRQTTPPLSAVKPQTKQQPKSAIQVAAPVQSQVATQAQSLAHLSPIAAAAAAPIQQHQQSSSTPRTTAASYSVPSPHHQPQPQSQPAPAKQPRLQRSFFIELPDFKSTAAAKDDVTMNSESAEHHKSIPLATDAERALGSTATHYLTRSGVWQRWDAATESESSPQYTIPPYVVSGPF